MLRGNGGSVVLKRTEEDRRQSHRNRKLYQKKKQKRRKTKRRSREKLSAHWLTGGGGHRHWRRRESISVCAPARALPTHQPHDHRRLMGTLNPEALHSPILLLNQRYDIVKTTKTSSQLCISWATAAGSSLSTTAAAHTFLVKRAFYQLSSRLDPNESWYSDHCFEFHDLNLFGSLHKFPCINLLCVRCLHRVEANTSTSL